jgi:8-oxo-dGTP pyrophosphatase MutT (NUDIX family)
MAANPRLSNELSEASIDAEQKDRAAGIGVVEQSPEDKGYWGIHDQQWLDDISKQLTGCQGILDGVLAPRKSVTFSSVKLANIMGVEAATLNHYMQIFAKKRETVFASEYAKLAGNAGRGLNREGEALMRTRERLSSLPYRVIDTTVTTNLDRLVRYIVNDSGCFDGMAMLYYLFYRWHRIDYSHIRSLEQEDIHPPYRDELIGVLKLLEERRWGYDSQELVTYLDEYFEYYARFISDPVIINALDYSYRSCNGYNSPSRTQYLLQSLWRVHRSFYTVEGSEVRLSSRADDKSPLLGQCLDPRRSIWAIEEPRVTDRIRMTTGPTWAGSFESAFATVVERRRRTEKALMRLRELARQKSNNYGVEQFEDMHLLLETANMIPAGHAHFNSGIRHYEDVEEKDFAHFDGLDFAIPYLSLIDSSPDALLGYKNFDFEADPLHLTPELEVGAFKPLLRDFFRDSRLRAMNAGYAGISEDKIYLYDAARSFPEGANGLPHFHFRAGRHDYFTGIARKDLFARFLVPSSGNLRRPLTWLLDHGSLPQFVHGKLPQRIQTRYASSEFAGLPSTMRLALLFDENPEEEQELLKLLSYEINGLYARLIKNSARRNSDDTLSFVDNGSTYTGCGTFILTSDVDEQGNDRPFLLMEKRWKVSEENDNLSYPSGGSCDFFTPDDRIPLDAKKIGGFTLEQIKDFEANPFMTAAREMREELNVLVSPSELRLISFGIDINRNLQQFSFLYESPHSAERILARKRFATTPREGFTFYLPFHRKMLLDVLNNYQLESGAVYSLMRLMTLKRDRLWD